MKVRVAVVGLLVSGTSAAQLPVPAPAPQPVMQPTPPAPQPVMQPTPQHSLQPTAQPATAPARAAIFPVHLEPGVHASLATLVADQLARSVVRRGYARVDAASFAAVSARAGAAGALSPARANELVRATGAALGVFASVGLDGGRYRVSVQLARADAAPATSAEAHGVSSDLYVDLDRVLVALLPDPALLRSAPATPPPPFGTAPNAPSAAPPEAFPEGHWRVALGTTAALGVSGGEFRNHLLGARFDRRFDEDVALGLAIYYANLKGKEGRAHNVLPWALFEYRIDLGADFAVPLRYATGWLPNNGPVVHAAAGLSVPLGDGIALDLELLAPSVWIVQERAVLSLDLAAELAFTF